jgi:hypothetical protein
MLWNVVASGKDYAGVGYEEWNTSVGKSFAERLRAKNMESGARSREITNDPSGDYHYTKLGKSYAKVFEHRRIDPKILTIKHDTYIYGEVFAYYYHYDRSDKARPIHFYNLLQCNQRKLRYNISVSTPILYILPDTLTQYQDFNKNYYELILNVIIKKNLVIVVAIIISVN